jgi:hypothetical protein
MVEPFAVLLAFVPLIGYLAVLSMIRLSGSTLVTTGGRDIAALGIAISGLIAVGPIELFFPRPAATLFGANVWIALAVFYTLSVTLIALNSRPKLVVYGRTPTEVFKSLLAVSQRIDPHATGDEETLQISLPSLGVRVRADGQKLADCTEIIAFEPNVSPLFWDKLLGELRRELGETTLTRKRYGFAMLLAACILSGLLLWQGYGNQELVVQGFKDWLWR